MRTSSFLGDYWEGFLVGAVLGVGVPVIIWAVSYGVAARTAADALGCPHEAERKWQCPQEDRR